MGSASHRGRIQVDRRPVTPVMIDAVLTFLKFTSLVTIWVSLATPWASADKGFCPPFSAKNSMNLSQNSHTTLKPSTPDARHIGAVQLIVEVSDKGYVCDVQVVRALDDKEADTQVKEAVRNWHFDPAKKDGRQIPATVLVEVDVWRNQKGEIVLQPPGDSPHPDSPTN